MSTLEQRYGRPARPRRRRLVLAGSSLLALLVTLVWIYWAAVVRSPDLNWDDVSYHVGSDAQTAVTFDVSFSKRAVKRAGAQPPTAICTIQALNVLQTQVGLLDVRVAPVRDNQVRTTVTLATSERATTGTVKDCVLSQDRPKRP